MTFEKIRSMKKLRSSRSFCGEEEEGDDDGEAFVGVNES